jgi:hypothetical protein
MNSQTSSLPINTSYAVDQVPGSLCVSSKLYTHAVVGRRDGIVVATTMDADFAATEVETEKDERTYWKNQKMLSLSEIGTLFLNDVGDEVALTHKGRLAANAYLLQVPTADSAIDTWKSFQADTVKKQRESGLGPISVLEWSTSEENARMAAEAFKGEYSEVQVVQCFISNL